MSKRPYMGVTSEHFREVFWSASVPTNATHGDKYLYVIGPFRSMRAARWMAEHPCTIWVGDAEKSCREVSHA